MEEKENVSKVQKTTGSYRFRVEGYSALSTKVGESIESPEFRICEYDWQLRIFPGGSLEAHKGYVSFYLASKSNKAARASYKLFVKSQMIGGADESFASSGVRHFEAKGIQVDGWGRDKFMSATVLMDPNNGFYDKTEDSVIFRVEITVIGELESLSNTNGYLVDSEHKCTLQHSLMALMEDQDLSDITLKVGKEVIFAHRSVLCSRSSVLRAMLCNSSFSEASSGIINIEGVNDNIVKELIHYMYTDRLSPQCNIAEVVVDLFAASSLYDVKGLFRICENYFISKLDRLVIITF